MPCGKKAFGLALFRLEQAPRSPAPRDMQPLLEWLRQRLGHNQSPAQLDFQRPLVVSGEFWDSNSMSES